MRTDLKCCTKIPYVTGRIWTKRHQAECKIHSIANMRIHVRRHQVEFWAFTREVWAWMVTEEKAGTRAATNEVTISCSIQLLFIAVTVLWDIFWFLSYSNDKLTEAFWETLSDIFHHCKDQTRVRAVNRRNDRRPRWRTTSLWMESWEAFVAPHLFTCWCQTDSSWSLKEDKMTPSGGDVGEQRCAQTKCGFVHFNSRNRKTWQDDSSN